MIEIDRIWALVIAFLLVGLAWGIVLSLPPVFAAEIPLKAWTWNTTPLVCFVDLDEKQRVIAAVSIGLWNTQFERIWDDPKYLVGFRLENATHFDKDCTVLAYYLDNAWAYDIDESKYLVVNGVAGCPLANAEDRICTLYVNTNNGTRDIESVFRTTLHELGHVWGLGHEKHNLSWELRNFPDGFTIMSSKPQNVPLGIHDGLADALKCKYPSGWGSKVVCKSWSFYWNVV